MVLTLLVLAGLFTAEDEVLPNGGTVGSAPGGGALPDVVAVPVAAIATRSDAYKAQAKLHLEEFRALDLDGDERITLAEFDEHMKGFGNKAMEAWDSDGDGMVRGRGGGAVRGR